MSSGEVLVQLYTLREAVFPQNDLKTESLTRTFYSGGFVYFDMQMLPIAKEDAVFVLFLKS